MCLTHDQILAHVNGEIDAVASTAAREHLAGCASCAAKAESYTRVGTLLRGRLAQCPAGRCLTENEIVGYLHRTMRTLPETRISEIESHFAVCEDCLDDLVALAECSAEISTLDTSSGSAAVKSAVLKRIAPVLARSGVQSRRMAARSASVRRLTLVTRAAGGDDTVRVFAIAAGVLIAVMTIVMVAGGSRTPTKIATAQKSSMNPSPLSDPSSGVDAPRIELAIQPDAAVTTGSRKPATATPQIRLPEPIIASAPPGTTSSTPSPAPKVEAPPAPAIAAPVVAATLAPGVSGDNPVATATQARSAVETPIKISRIDGTATLITKSDAKGDAATAPLTLQSEDRLVASGGAPVRLTIGAHAIDLREKASLSGILRDGAVALRLHEGEALFTVARNGSDFHVETDAAMITVRGTVFAVAAEPEKTTLTVLEGSVDFGNRSGRVSVGKGQQSAASKNGAPSTPRKSANAAALVSWAQRRPADDPKAATDDGAPRLSIERASAQKHPGLVVTAVYADVQPVTEPLARTIVQVSGCGAVYGYNHLRSGAKWYAVDRALEGPVDASGKVGAVTVTKQAKEIFDGYVRDIALSAGLQRPPVKLLVEVRSHWLRGADKQPLAVVEMATNGFGKRTLEGAKTAWAQIAKKHGIEQPMPVLFDRVDADYSAQGGTYKFHFPHLEQKSSGSMRTAVAERAIALYWNGSLNKRDTVEPYGRALSELINWLYWN